jgi:hypothetical protein
MLIRKIALIVLASVLVACVALPEKGAQDSGSRSANWAEDIQYKEIVGYCHTCLGPHHPDCNELNYRRFIDPFEAEQAFCATRP